MGKQELQKSSLQKKGISLQTSVLKTLYFTDILVIQSMEEQQGHCLEACENADPPQAGRIPVCPLTKISRWLGALSCLRSLVPA